MTAPTAPGAFGWPAPVAVPVPGPRVTVVVPATPGPAAADGLHHGLGAQSTPPHQVLAADDPRTVLDAVTGTHLLLLGPADVLHPVALEVLGAAAAGSGRPSLVWGDDDAVSDDGTQLLARYRTGWDPDRLPFAPVVGGPVLVARSVVAEGLPAIGHDGLDRLWWDLTRRAAQHLGGWATTRHVPAVLQHRVVVGPLAVDVPDLRAAHDLGAGSRPRVSVLVPTAGSRRDDGRRHVDVLLASLLEGRPDPGVDLEVVVAVSDDRGTPRPWRPQEDRRVRVVSVPGPFSFSRTVDVLATHARTDLLLLLNDDVEPVTDDWLGRLVDQLQVDGTGAVGARLEYPDGRLQHVGLGLVDGLPYHLLPGADPEQPGTDYDRVASLPHGTTCVTGACLLVRREVFERVGGLSQQLPMNFNDVDLGLTLTGLGLRVVVEPRAVLVHHESASRVPVVLSEEVATLRRRWPAVVDPFLSRPRAVALGLGPALQRADEAAAPAATGAA